MKTGNVRQFLNSIEVVNTGLTKMRLGNRNDGGYVVFVEGCKACDSLYSFGVGDDVGFEIDFIQRFDNAKAVMLYDPTIDELPDYHEKFLFFKEDVRQSIRLACLHNAPMLKIDVEHCEWKALNILSDEDFEKIPQIVAEFHLLHVEPPQGLSPYFHRVYKGVSDSVNAAMFDFYWDVLLKLKKHFYIGHLHPNNSLPLVNIEGNMVPPLLELTFINKSLVHSVEPITNIKPIFGLDFPNKTDRPDVEFLV